ncbi:MAG: DUF4350 domain-containing protein [Thermoguttaceae bacterium]
MRRQESTATPKRSAARLRFRKRRPPAFLLYPLSFILIFSAGCQRDLETTYGQRNGPGATTSVNGTGVLGTMFEAAGHKVVSMSALSPRLSRWADCIVWFPDDFQPPSEKVRKWLERWLSEAPGRTLIYVGRDFDAAPWYWEKVLPLAPADQKELIRGRLADARLSFQGLREDVSKSVECEWFTVRHRDRARKIRTLSGEESWLADVDPAKVEIQLATNLEPDGEADTLLKSGDDVLVSSATVGKDGVGELIVVANGSFLLNAMLVNHEHRKLAGKLIDRIGPPKKHVAFLESWSGGPPIYEKDPSGFSTGVEIFHLWPANWILMHMAAVGILFCFARWPIFGRPREAPGEPVADFGKHIDALALLLARSRDRSHAMARLLHYQQTTRGG